MTLECLAKAEEVLKTRKDEMTAWGDDEGANFLENFVLDYKSETARWQSIRGRLATCTTNVGESFLDSSLRYGWV